MESVVAKGISAFKRRRWWEFAILLLLAVSCAAMVLPLPVLRTPEKDRSEPFPCMNNPCGCGSAEQCWKQCCCYTNRQKVEWAARNRVLVPDFVVAAAEEESRKSAAETAQAATPKCAHCEHCKTTSGSSAQSRDTTVVADLHSDSPNCSAASGPTKQRRTEKRYTSVLLALECHGLSSLWQILSVSMLPNVVAIEEQGDPVTESSPLRSLRFLSRDPVPPDPPPRLRMQRPVPSAC
ncbi:MAG: hypothetical protein R3C49_03685 [Planctomycetaceae bacterium]